MTAPLSGIRVVEAANYVAGPSAGGLMADLGADVIKIEPPGGEVVRGVQAAGPGEWVFTLENRGKRSVTVDLAAPGGPELVHELLAHADVFLTNLIAPRLRKYRLMPADVHAVAPRVVHVSVSGYGITGPESDRPAFDFAGFWARSGIMGVVGHPGQPPVLSRVAQGDHTTGVTALAATLAALRLRDLTGEGQTVEIALQHTGVYTIATDVARALVDGKQPPRFDRERPSNPLFNTYETADGEWVMLVHMTPDPYWPRLCAALDEPGWATDARYTTMASRAEHGPALFPHIQGHFHEHPLAYWSERLDAHGLIWAPMVTLPEVVRDPQLHHRGAFPAVPGREEGFRTVAAPFYFHDPDASRPRGPAPEAGEHTFAVLTELGFSEERISALAAAGVLG
jgi:crotonobetainyl-CoA:carnitine CoA-transferase CaiB-like acyl-CoA transferase